MNSFQSTRDEFSVLFNFSHLRRVNRLPLKKASALNHHAIERQTQWSRIMRSKNPQSFVAGAALAALLSAAIEVVAQSTPSRSLLALSKRNHRLAKVDPKTLQVIARVPVGPDPTR